jgi:galactokinase
MTITPVFREMFGADPAVCVRAPGRVNLIGEHIDFNGGHVLPIAINRAIKVAVSPRADGRYRLYAAQFDKLWEGTLPKKKSRQHFWTNYFFGVVHEFRKLGHELKGADAVVSGDLPRASGLSSSAAFEVAVAWAIQQMLGTELSRMDIALLAQRAENRFVGVDCGVMDQAISAGGRAGHAMLLDCNALGVAQIPLGFEERAIVMVAHSGVRRGLSASAYNERRTQCNAALEAIRTETGRDLACLCNATLEDLEASRDAMDEAVYRRARHAITEEARVHQAIEALHGGDLKRFGALLDASHASLRDDYEVSCDELDKLTGMIRSNAGVYGSRLTGAGFGGCTVSLVEADAAEHIVEGLKKDYYKANDLEPIIFTTKACDGTGRQ